MEAKLVLSFAVSHGPFSIFLQLPSEAFGRGLEQETY